MALLDPRRGCIVIRVIYDGPAFAGKTTNLRTLARSLESKLYSGEESDGRTLYFDWVDYMGGLFEGMPIRCQIVSVPGQRILERRRRLLLETSDVVVFVADSRSERLKDNVRSFKVLGQVLTPMVPPVGIVVQANKRDLKGAITLDALRDALDRDRLLALTEAVAESGEGVRETFVLAVRLALDRVRELWNRKELPKIEPGIDDGDQLLSAMKATESVNLASLSSLGLGAIERRSPIEGAASPPPASPPPSGGVPPLPNASVPPGLVWPPVGGRIVVHESTRVMTRIERRESGDWLGFSSEWMLRSPLKGLFFHLEEARAALVSWARWHSAVAERLSQPRCIVLMPEASEVWRLWQIVRRVPTLSDTARELFEQSDDLLLGEGLFKIIDLRLRAERDFVTTGWLGRLGFSSVSVSEAGAPLFAGFSPYSDRSLSTVGSAKFDEDRLIRDELAPLLRGELRLAPHRISAVLTSLRKVALANRRGHIAKSIQQSLLGS